MFATKFVHLKIVLAAMDRYLLTMHMNKKSTANCVRLHKIPEKEPTGILNACENSMN